MIRRAVTPEKFRPVGGPRRLDPPEIGKGDVSAEVAPPRVAREHRTRRAVDLGHDERRGSAPRHAKDPLDVGRHGQPAWPSRLVRQRKHRDLDGVVERHELQQLERDAMRDVLEACVALSVPDDIGRRGLVDRQRGRPP